MTTEFPNTVQVVNFPAGTTKVLLDDWSKNQLCFYDRAEAERLIEETRKTASARYAEWLAVLQETTIDAEGVPGSVRYVRPHLSDLYQKRSTYLKALDVVMDWEGLFAGALADENVLFIGVFLNKFTYEDQKVYFDEVGARLADAEPSFAWLKRPAE